MVLHRCKRRQLRQPMHSSLPSSRSIHPSSQSRTHESLSPTPTALFSLISTQQTNPHRPLETLHTVTVHTSGETTWSDLTIETVSSTLQQTSLPPSQLSNICLFGAQLVYKAKDSTMLRNRISQISFSVNSCHSVTEFSRWMSVNKLAHDLLITMCMLVVYCEAVRSAMPATAWILVMYVNCFLV